jgi:hypothetical protein
LELFLTIVGEIFVAHVQLTNKNQTIQTNQHTKTKLKKSKNQNTTHIPMESTQQLCTN